MIDRFRQCTPIAGQFIKVGDLATYYVGSDSYADEVASISRSKTGEYVGRIKAITLKKHGKKFDGSETSLPFYAKTEICTRHNDFVASCLQCNLQKNGIYIFRAAGNRGHLTLSVGAAIDYQNPSF